jgi:nucleotide-binding universal stress UspA family protein
MFEKILLPLDGSTLAERSIPHAIAFARKFNSKIELLRVLEPNACKGRAQFSEPLQWQLLKTEATIYLDSISKRLCSALNLSQNESEDRVNATVLEGKIAESIVDFSKKEAINLLIICTHGASGLSRWNLNSVSNKVINLVYSNVLIIRSYSSTEADLYEPPYDRILIPIDFSLRAECALNAGIALAEESHSQLILTSVIKPLEVPEISQYQQEMQELSDRFMTINTKALNHYLNDISQRLTVENKSKILINSRISQAILNLSDEENIDLLILCAHGHTGDFNRPFGMVAHSCIIYGTQPVLVLQDQPPSHIKISAAEQVSKQTKSRE